MNITIIGSGKIGRALASRFMDAGHNITLVGHTPGHAEAVIDELKKQGKKGDISLAMPNTLPGEIVMLAVPYPVVESVIHQFIELLPGKILVDVTNPINFQTMQPIVASGSGVEEIARLAPVSTRVVKAFNTVFAKSLLAEHVDCGPLDVLIAGDDADAKATISRLAEDCGLHPIDTGPLMRSRQIEAMELLHMSLQSSQNLGYKSAIKIVT